MLAAEMLDDQPRLTYSLHHSQYLAHRLTLLGVDEDAFARSLSTAKVDMNPHQADNLFAPEPGDAI